MADSRRSEKDEVRRKKADEARTAIQAVTFDVGGTLITPWPSVGHVYAEIAARQGFGNVSPAELNRRFAAAWKQLKDFRHTRAQWAALVDETFKGLLRDLPSETFFPELYDRFTEPDAWHVFEDVVPALETLKQRGLKLGVISNWDDRLRPLLRGLQLHERFNSIVVSCETGAPKPAPAIFQRAAAELELPPEAILHVGDSPAMDVDGARAAGFRAVRLARRGTASPPGRLRSLEDLPGILG